jgi:hypothetical protein
VASQSVMRVRIHNNVRLNTETLFGSEHLWPHLGLSEVNLDICTSIRIC